MTHIVPIVNRKILHFLCQLFMNSAVNIRMKYPLIFSLLLCVFFSGCGRKNITQSDVQDSGKSPAVKVAAIQMYSEIGNPKRNALRMAELVREGAEKGAKIIVTPECSIPGYMNIPYGVKWAREQKPEEGELDADIVAETVPGYSTRYFGKLSDELDIYLSISLIEKADGNLYNTQVLLGPEGKIRAHHRKQNLWAEGDGLWASKGDRPVQYIDTEYGRLGLMICYDVHRLTAIHAENNVDIILYSVGWYGPNTKSWFTSIFPARYLHETGMSVIAANWSADKVENRWSGAGYSCIIENETEVKAIADTEIGDHVVIGTLPITK